MILSLIISLLGLSFLLINCVLFYSLPKSKNLLIKILTVYLILLFLEECICNYIGFNFPNSNFFLSHYYFIFQFIFLSLFFYNLFSNVFIKSTILILLVAELVFLAKQYYDSPGIYWNFNIFEIGSTSVLLLSYAVLFLVMNFKKAIHDYFYFCAGLIIYLSSSSIIFLSGNTELVLFTEPFYLDIWIFNSLFYILYQYLIFKEWKYLKNKSKEIVI